MKMYNSDVSKKHQEQATEHARIREANEIRIKQLEDIEQRMVNDLQNTLQQKNNAMNKLASKSKGLQKVMQPRMAYKYAARGENSSTNLMAQAATSSYAFSGRKASAFNHDQAMTLYNQRAKSIASDGGNTPAAAPKSGAGSGIMFNNQSETELETKNGGAVGGGVVKDKIEQQPITDHPTQENIPENADEQ